MKMTLISIAEGHLEAFEIHDLFSILTLRTSQTISVAAIVYSPLDHRLLFQGESYISLTNYNFSTGQPPIFTQLLQINHRPYVISRSEKAVDDIFRALSDQNPY